MSNKFPPILTSAVVKSILNGKNRVSLDLGLTETTINRINSNTYGIMGETVDDALLEKIVKRPNTACFIQDGQAFMVAITGKHFYKLVPTAGAPTLEIDGIRMHRTKDTTPDKDAEKKLKKIGLDHGKVLDTCMGLGYTSIHSKESGADVVITIELEPDVNRIALLNPWSRRLYHDPSIHKIIGDSFYVVDSFQDDFFDYVIHDPPRHGHAGHLYGLEFYRKLSRVIKHGGRMFHYTGEPRSRFRGVNLQKGITKRLKTAGFHSIRYHPEVMGVTCEI